MYSWYSQSPVKHSQSPGSNSHSPGKQKKTKNVFDSEGWEPADSTQPAFVLLLDAIMKPFDVHFQEFCRVVNERCETVPHPQICKESYADLFYCSNWYLYCEIGQRSGSASQHPEENNRLFGGFHIGVLWKIFSKKHSVQTWMKNHNHWSDRIWEHQHRCTLACVWDLD